MTTWVLIIISTFSGYVGGKSIYSIEFKSNKSCQNASTILNSKSGINAYCVENKTNELEVTK